jgi:hypothetical protein
VAIPITSDRCSLECGFVARYSVADMAPKRVNILGVALPVFTALAGCASSVADSPFALTDKNFSAWKAHIQPDRSELAWTQIPWLPTFAEGLVHADAEQKPLLLWVMNGHPLGCT